MINKIILDFNDCEYVENNFYRWSISNEEERRLLSNVTSSLEIVFVRDDNIVDNVLYKKCVGEPFIKGLSNKKNQFSIIHEVVATLPIISYRVLS